MFNLEKLIEEGGEESSLSKLLNTFISPLLICLFLAAILILNFVPSSYYLANAAYVKATVAPNGPTVNDPNLKVEKVFSGELNLPTSMAFLGPNDILVLEKNKGTVDRILNGKLMPNRYYKFPTLLMKKLNGDYLELQSIGEEMMPRVLHTCSSTILKKDLVVKGQLTIYIDMNSHQMVLNLRILHYY